MSALRLIRVWFAKKDEGCYISHLDLQKVVQRAIKKANVPVWYTQGFNPHLYLTFALPLSLGQGGLFESFDFKTEAELDVNQLIIDLNSGLPKDIVVTKIAEAKMSPADIKYADYTISFSENTEYVKESLEKFRKQETATFDKKTKSGIPKQVDILEHIVKWKVEQSDGQTVLYVTLPTGNSFNLNPDVIVKYLNEHYSVNPFISEVLRTAVLTETFNLFA